MFSSQPKLLVTGISGFLGSCIAHLDQKDWSITGVYNHNAVSHYKIKTIQSDLTNPESLIRLFEKVKPDAVIHLAALSNPNYCEEYQDASFQANVNVPVEIARLCKTRSVPLIFPSTDLVFDGKNAPYSENDQCSPVNIYGQHKLLAEKEIINIHPEACVVRLPVMFGLPTWGNSFMKSWLKNLKSGKKVNAFTDEFRSKVSGNSAVEGMLLLLNKKEKGIWHLGGRERISRYEFAVKMAQIFDLPTDLIQPSIQADVQMAAARPADVSLDSTKAFEKEYTPPSIATELRSMKEKSKFQSK